MIRQRPVCMMGVIKPIQKRLNFEMDKSVNSLSETPDITSGIAQISFII